LMLMQQALLLPSKPDMILRNISSIRLSREEKKPRPTPVRRPE